MITCKNCGRPAEGSFCSHCGQKTNIDRITIRGLLLELPHSVFHVDKGIIYNVRELFTNPGTAINEYLEGRRKKFFNPATYLLIALIINYIIVKVYNMHFYDAAELIGMEPLKAKAIKDYDAMQWWFLEHTYIYILFAICASGLFLYGLYKISKNRYNLAESATIVLFIIAQGVLIQSFIYLCFGWVDSGPFLRNMESVNMPILILYASIANYQLLSSVNNKFLRIIYAFIAGAGLAVLWIATAYLLYLLFT